MMGELYFDSVNDRTERGAFAIICSRGVDGNIADVYGETVEEAMHTAMHIIQAVNSFDEHEDGNLDDLRKENEILRAMLEVCEADNQRMKLAMLRSQIPDVSPCNKS